MTPVYADKPFPLLATPRFRKGKDAKLDIFDECASAMACVHNVVIRGLNSIYLQAPHVQPADEESFCEYIGHWHGIISMHHTAEEEDGFPMIEKMAGEKGIMDDNVEQHRVFHGGLDALGKYAADCVAGSKEYDGKKIVSMIDEFGGELAKHLEDEIPTIEGLRRYGERKMAGLKGALEAEAERNKANTSMVGLCVLFSMHDANYEGGLWADWPPMPSPVRFMCKNVLMPWYGDVVKFGPADNSGALRPLYAVPQQ